jgi:hypothetical protein
MISIRHKHFQKEKDISYNIKLSNIGIKRNDPKNKSLQNTIKLYYIDFVSLMSAELYYVLCTYPVFLLQILWSPSGVC